MTDDEEFVPRRPDLHYLKKRAERFIDRGKEIGFFERLERVPAAGVPELLEQLRVVNSAPDRETAIRRLVGRDLALHDAWYAPGGEFDRRRAANRAAEVKRAQEVSA